VSPEGACKGIVPAGIQNYNIHITFGAFHVGQHKSHIQCLVFDFLLNVHDGLGRDQVIEALDLHPVSRIVEKGSPPVFNFMPNSLTTLFISF
jgi:hypothetical protein